MLLNVKRVVATSIGLCLITASPLAAEDSSPRDDTRYLYSLSKEAIADCAITQSYLSRTMTRTDPEWSRFHRAMSEAWKMVGDAVNDEPFTKEFADARIKAMQDRTPEGMTRVQGSLLIAQECDVISRIHPEYNIAVQTGKEKFPKLFADNAGYKLQTGGEFPNPPTKEMTIGEWELVARGNSCIATRESKGGGTLVFGFTNFGDGAIRFSSKKLPKLDVESDDYQDDFAKHLEGIAYDEDYTTILAEGVTYEAFKGSGVFVDGKLLAGLTDGSTNQRNYVFGQGVQSTYYNALPTGTELTIKALGKERLRISLDDPAFWNEMSNCVAQYPFG